jgi:hypothetical protein
MFVSQPERVKDGSGFSGFSWPDISSWKVPTTHRKFSMNQCGRPDFATIQRTRWPQLFQRRMSVATMLLLLCTHLCLPNIAWAQSSPQPINLDLGSTTRDMTSGSVARHGPVAIRIGDGTRQIDSTSLLTPAERLAVYQIISTGSQSIALSQLGNAVGGSFTIGEKFSTYVNELVIAAGVTALKDVGTSNSLNLTGNLINSGALYFYSTSGPRTANISALNITNNAGAQISSVLPANLPQSLNAASNPVSLNLTAVNNLINSGSITSAGSLSLTAGNSIVNECAVIQATGNLNLQAPHIHNQGLIAAQLGDISILTTRLNNSGSLTALSGSLALQSMTDGVLNINNSLGTIAAAQLLRIETTQPWSLESKPILLLSGGTLSSRSILLKALGAPVQVHPVRIEGPVQIKAALADIGVAEGDLQIETLDLTGDPIFFSQAGNLNLGFLSGGTFSTNGGDFIALAKGNITTGAADGLLDASGTGRGGQVVIAAGVNFSVGTDTNCTDCSGLFNITGASGSGGNVTLGPISIESSGNTIKLEAHSGQTSPGNIQIANVSSTGRAGAAVVDSRVGHCSNRKPRQFRWRRRQRTR